jgi:hypothetical protein
MSNSDQKSTLRQLLEEGAIDPRLLAKLDLLEEMKAAVARKDTAALQEIGKKLLNNARELQASDLTRRDAMNAAVEKANKAAEPDERTAMLLEAFEFCARTRVVAFDEAADTDSGNAATKHLAEIAEALDAIPPGRRSALVPFLDNANRGVQAAAAVHLKAILPERAIPILKEIKAKDHGSAGWSAFWALPPDEHESSSPPPEECGGKP